MEVFLRFSGGFLEVLGGPFLTPLCAAFPLLFRDFGRRGKGYTPFGVIKLYYTTRGGVPLRTLRPFNIVPGPRP